MSFNKIGKRLGYSRQEVIDLLYLRPEIKKRKIGRHTSAFISEETLATLSKQTNTPRKDIPTTKAPTNASGDILSYDQMIQYVAGKTGDDGHAAVVSIISEHEDDVQVGDNRFSRAKLDEFLKELNPK